MLLNYFKIAWRNLNRNKLFSAINIAGMALGISVCFFALLYVTFELSYDTQNEKADRIYRLVTDVETSTGTDYKSTTGAMAPALQAAFPEIEKSARVFLDYLVFQKDRGDAREEKIAYADSSLFSVFTLPFLSGNPETALNAPNQVVLSETAARWYFGSENPVGKTLLVNGHELTTVTGVMRDMPHNAHFRTDFMVSLATLGSAWHTNSKRFFFYTYLLLPEHCNVVALSQKMTNFIRQRTEQNQGKFTLSLEPLTEVYLQGKARGSRSGSSVSGSLSNVYIFSLVAAFVLFIASFNFINLTTAFATKRRKEVGVRKYLGAERRQLIGQFLTDAVLITLFSFGLAIVVCVLALPFFNDLAGKVISPGILQSGRYLLWLFAIALVIGLMSGVYPAFFLSGFHPVTSLKGASSAGFRGGLLRQVLVVAQFAISSVLIISTLVVYTQLGHMRNHELGFSKDHKLIVDFQFNDSVIDRSDVFKQTIARLPGVERVSLSSGIPGRANHTFPTQIENQNRELQTIESNAYFIDPDFLEQYKIQVVAGRTLSSRLSSDSTEAMLINETAARALGFSQPQDALGRRFEQLHRSGRIMGVIKDFHFQSLQEAVQPLALRISPGFFTFMSFDISSENIPETVAGLKAEWQKLAPDVPFVYFFADEAYNQQYAAEERFGKLFLYLALVAIFISCLGLFGLATFTAEQRTKEIGVRKVLGASVGSITALLSKDFLKLVAISILIASPIAWYTMNAWLQDFAYKIDISWWVFALAGLLAVGIAVLTVSFQSVRAALMNPVESLRSE